MLLAQYVNASFRMKMRIFNGEIKEILIRKLNVLVARTGSIFISLDKAESEVKE